MSTINDCYMVKGMKQKIPFFMCECVCCSICENMYVDVCLLIDAEVIVCEVVTGCVSFLGRQG